MTENRKEKASRQTFKGSEARRWLLEQGRFFINDKSKRIQIDYGSGTQEAVDEKGQSMRFEYCGYVITCRRGSGLPLIWYALLDDYEAGHFSFNADAIQEIIFDTSREICLWDAFYRIIISMRSGLIELSYDPPFKLDGAIWWLPTIFHRESFRVEM